MIVTSAVAVVMGIVGVTATASTCGGGTSDWAIPANTAMLVALAFVQQRHYKRTAQVERIVDKRKRQEVPPPDGEYKRDSDPIPPPHK